MNTTSASLLLDLKQSGTPAAWAKFVRMYSPILYNWARRMRLQESDALDLVQDVFASLLSKMRTFEYDAERGFRDWLWIVTRNKFIEKSRRKRLPVDASVQTDRVPGSEEPGVEEIEFRNHVARQLVPALKHQFQPATWTAFWETVVAGRTPAEVAAELGMSIDAVYKAKARVVSRLHTELADLVNP
jgi:RNA polymerase sigma-70 factor (ECF subfamily)